MNEIFVYITFWFTGIHLSLVLLLLAFADGPGHFPGWLMWPCFVTVPLLIACITYSTETSKQEKVTLIERLEYQETIRPKYVYEYDQYMFFHPSQDEPLQISNLQGYTSDSAAVVDGILVYKKIYPRVWGFIEHVPKGKQEYLFTLELTPEIERASQLPVKLKE